MNGIKESEGGTLSQDILDGIGTTLTADSSGNTVANTTDVKVYYHEYP